MAKRRRYRRRNRIDPAPFVVAGLAVALFLVWLIARREVHKPPRPTLSMDQARAFNAHVPFVTSRMQPAIPFHFRGTPAAREQAAQCLATVALYEAGSDERGQQAVIQVVLNRVRLPQFPKTVCGVVYQGSTLPTGCQFSFTCDGSQLRRPEHAGWEAARHHAKRALDGYVFRPVGRATHYHADWMVPYWIGSLDKIAQIRSHIFYRPKDAGTAQPVTCG
jgi:spore germination cell wall hydrolase CwlJ-like protein